MTEEYNSKYAAARKFERLMNHSFDELEEIGSRPGVQNIDESQLELIATIKYDFKAGTTTVTRVKKD